MNGDAASKLTFTLNVSLSGSLIDGRLNLYKVFTGTDIVGRLDEKMGGPILERPPTLTFMPISVNEAV